MRILFIDATISLLARYPITILEELEKDNNKVEAYFISYDSGYEGKEQTNAAYSKIREYNNIKIINGDFYNKKNITKILQNINPDLILFGGYRVPDVLWITICNIYKYNTVLLQHGFDIDHIQRSTLSVFKNINKNYKYIKALAQISKLIGEPFFLILLLYLRHLIMGLKLQKTRINNKLTFPTKFLIYSEFYKDLFNSKYGIDKSRMKIVGSIDIFNTLRILKNKRIDSVCYLAQTFVEDNRMQLKDFKKLVLFYKELAIDLDSFYIKFHPRSNQSLYKELTDLPNVKVALNYFPNCSSYIGHYSSTLFTACYLSNNIIIHEIKHESIPDIYQSCATLISKDINEIKRAILNSMKTEPDISKVEKKIGYIAPMPKNNPISLVKDEIIYLNL